MTVSTTTDFSLSAEQLVREARSLLGISASEEPMAAHELEEGLRALNMMLKTWEADGVMAWSLAEGALSAVQSTASYALSTTADLTPAPPDGTPATNIMDIVQMRITRNGYDLEMSRRSRSEYYAFPLKTNEGYPTQFFYDRQRASGTLYVWPVPDATGGTFKFTYRRRILDLDSGANDFDMPQEWFEAVTYGLAKRLIPRYGRAGSPNAQLVAQMADQTYIIVKAYDAGEGQSSITVLPNMDGR